MTEQLPESLSQENSISEKYKLKGHFFCGVIVPITTEDIEEASYDLLIPFIHPHEDIEDADGTDFSAILNEDKGVEKTNQCCHIWETNKPDLHCNFCHSSLRRESDKCPTPKIFWGNIGGLYNGLIKGIFEGPMRRRIDWQHPDNKTLQNNISIVEEVIEHKCKCSAIVTPDGIWHQQGGDGKGFSAKHSSNSEKWASERLALLMQYRDHYIVGYHCYEIWDGGVVERQLSDVLESL